MKTSVVIPVYNAEKTIAQLVAEIENVLSHQQFEIILVNDGSKDKSEKICKELAAKSCVKFLSLRKNFGEHNAVMCGLNFVDGDIAVVLDDDFQTPPSEIMMLVNEVHKGFDVVYSKYDHKKHNWFRNLGSRFHNMIATILLNKPANLYLSSFKAIKKEIVNEIIKYKGPFPYIDGLLLRVTNNIGTLPVSHEFRKVGKSNYTFGKLFSLYLNMFFNFSIRPLRIFTITGFVIFLLGILSSIAFIIEKLLYPEIPLGWASIIVVVLMLSGFQILFLGLIGEYLGKQYLDQNATPQWVIKMKIID
ncbi:MAG: glycosyltransferase family 2 protein [Cytophagales bacterium]|nr:glycosyltransferase family 2 protein [Cytophagales bacterium]